MSAFRPLPPKPSLEFEHKEAKALLRQLRARDADAVARARARPPAIADYPPRAIRQSLIPRNSPTRSSSSRASTASPAGHDSFITSRTSSASGSIRRL
jgi:hypothetical protein